MFLAIPHRDIKVSPRVFTPSADTSLMAKKFCPMCNRNVSLAFKDGKLCCSCCGYSADYMTPPVSEQYSSSRPATQEEVPVKPDVHEREPGEPIVIEVGPAMTMWCLAVITILVSFLMALTATYVTEMTWTYDDGTSDTGTVLSLFSARGQAWVPPALTLVNLVFIVLAPRYLGVCYFVMGITAMSGATEVTIDDPFGVMAFVLSLVVGFFIHMWSKYVGPGKCGMLHFFSAFWLRKAF